MEKRVPHYALQQVKDLIECGAYRITSTARVSAYRDFSLDEPSQIAECVLHLVPAQFHKSMTTYEDHRIWQDVYYSTVQREPAYIKVQIVSETTVVISFKRR